MKNRARDYYRHHRDRTIKKKLHILKRVLNNDVHPFFDKPGMLSKRKIHCSCKMCKYDKHYSIPKAQVQSQIHCMDNELKEFFNSDH